MLGHVEGPPRPSSGKTLGMYEVSDLQNNGVASMDMMDPEIPVEIPVTSSYFKNLVGWVRCQTLKIIYSQPWGQAEGAS